MTADPQFVTATAALVLALHRAVTHGLNGDTYADVDEAWDAYDSARLDALTTAGGPYPVMGQRGWVWLDDAPGIGDRTADGRLRCQSRAMREADGVPYRCRRHASHGQPCDFVPEREERP